MSYRAVLTEATRTQGWNLLVNTEWAQGHQKKATDLRSMLNYPVDQLTWKQKAYVEGIITEAPVAATLPAPAPAPVAPAGVLRQWVRMKQACKQLDAPRATLDNWAEQGLFPRKRVNGEVYVELVAARNYLQSAGYVRRAPRGRSKVQAGPTVVPTPMPRVGLTARAQRLVRMFNAMAKELPDEVFA